MKKEDFLAPMMQVPPKQKIAITPFDLKTQREAFSVSLEGLKGVRRVSMPSRFISHYPRSGTLTHSSRSRHKHGRTGRSGYVHSSPGPALTSPSTKSVYCTRLSLTALVALRPLNRMVLHLTSLHTFSLRGGIQDNTDLPPTRCVQFLCGRSNLACPVAIFCVVLYRA